MSDKKNLVLASNAGAYCYPWANSAQTLVLTPELAFSMPKLIDNYAKVILINGLHERWLFHERWSQQPKPDSYFFLWDPARCPNYAPSPCVLEQLGQLHTLYSFQQEDCKDFGLQFNSTMYAPPAPDMFLPQPEHYDVLFLGVPKDRLPLLRQLHEYFSVIGLRTKFRIGLIPGDPTPQEDRGDWLITREWLRYPAYLQLVMQSRCLLDLYQVIQTGYSLRVMEHLFFGKKLITNNRVIGRAEFYHPNNIFLLYENKIEELAAWLALPFVPVDEEIKDYYRFDNWVKRFV